MFVGSALALLCLFTIGTGSAFAVPPQIGKTKVSKVTGTTATFEADINPQGKVTRYHFEYGTAGPCEPNPCISAPFPEGELPAGSSPAHVELPVEGLSPATVYYFRVVAKNGETSKGLNRVFATLSAPSSGLPDGRAYEQSSPTDKNGGDAVGQQTFVKAADDGEGITFGSTFGIPGGVGAQGLPLYLGSRQGSAGWSTQGLFPPATLGERALVLGWLPDYSETFANATKLGNPRTKALFALSTTGKDPVMVSPYVVNAEYFYAGTSADASTVAFESQAVLPGNPAAIDGSSNVYAWDRATSTLKLASVFNDGASPSKGAFAGPYDWSRGTKTSSLREGGGASAYYLEEERAITASGDVYFTAAITGQLYLRVNPTQAQSPLNGEDKCTNSALACTIQVSASQKTNGDGPDGTDPAGPQPSAFQAASADGTKAFFTSPEKLTNDANTGPEQPLAAIGRGGIGGGIEDASFIPTHAVGVAVDSAHIYWADPSLGTIGRADIDGAEGSVEPAFISPGTIECEIEDEPGEFESVPTKPRYVAVDAGHVYWTNSGCPDENERPSINGGTIGRSDIDGTTASIETEFITGASDPQGIAVNATHIYWANKREPTAIGRADIDGDPDSIDQSFIRPGFATFPIGVALSPTHVYFTLIQGEAETEGSYVYRAPLDGGEEEFVFVDDKLRGIAVDATNVYWAAQGEEAIGRIPIVDFPKFGPCEGIPSCEKDFISVEGALNGLAADAAHLYWSVNGEAPTNPGNDLYRYEPNFADPGEPGTLSDLTPDPSTINGAEVQGVAGTSADGSRVYFVANAVLDDAEEATPGDCHGTVVTINGSCNLYLWEEGAITFVARLKGSGLGTTSDTTNWVGTPIGVFGSNASYAEKTARTSPDGQTLLFRSTEQLSDYDNEGVPELYRFEVGDAAGIRCVSCSPSGEAVGSGPSMGSVVFPGMSPTTSASTASRNLSADGNRVFFETPEALVPADTNGQGGCPPSGSDVQQYPACLDVYQWVAPNTPASACKQGSEAYSPLNGGCIYLISTGKSEFPSLFADASASGNDVFFFTRQSLVGQDKDELQDVYDARVGGGLASQNPPSPVICTSAESCHGAVPPAPSEPAAGSATFVGPGDPLPKHKKQKAKKHKSKKQKKHHKKQKRANSKRRASR